MKTLEQIFEILEQKNISIDNVEESHKICGYELNTYTKGGVNQIIFLDFRESGNVKDPKDFIDKFSEYIEEIDIDAEIELHREMKGYKENFTFKQSIKDFKKWKKDLKKLVAFIKKTIRDKVEDQILLQEKMQRKAKINLVNCGHCGSTFFHKIKPKAEDELIECPYCPDFQSASDCSDFFYEGVQNNEEFDEPINQ